MEIFSMIYLKLYYFFKPFFKDQKSASPTPEVVQFLFETEPSSDSTYDYNKY